MKRTIAMTECFILLKCIIKSEDSSLSLGQFGFQFYFFKQTALFYQIFLNHCRTLNFKGFLIYVLYRCQNSASNLSVPQDKGTDMSVRFLCLGCTHGLWNLPYSTLQEAFSINQSDALEQSLQAHLSRDDRI